MSAQPNPPGSHAVAGASASRRGMFKLAGAGLVAGTGALTGTPTAHAGDEGSPNGNESHRRPHPPRGRGPSRGLRHPPATTERKLIEMGWDVPGPVFLRDNIHGMEEKPFDGVSFSLYENPTGKWEKHIATFDPTPLTDDVLQLDVLSSIEWDRFTDNFLLLSFDDRQTGHSFFDDDHWAGILANARRLGSVVDAAGAMGYIIDPESGRQNAWRFNDKTYPGRTFAETEEKASERGQQFIEALLETNSDLSVLFLKMRHQMRTAVTLGYAGRAPESLVYALLPAFIDGVLGGCRADTQVFDGSEVDYWRDESSLWAIHRRLEESAWFTVSPERRQEFNGIARGSTVYLDLFTGNIPAKASRFPYYEDLTPDWLSQWRRHNMYHSMLGSDKYVWVRSEDMDWWRDDVFPGAEEDIVWAADQYRSGEALGWEMTRPGGNANQPSIQTTIITKPTVHLKLFLEDDPTPLGHGTSLAADQTVMVRVELDRDLRDLARLEVYDNGELLGDAGAAYGGYNQLMALWADAGDHTVVARAFFTDRTHMTSNVIGVHAE